MTSLTSTTQSSSRNSAPRKSGLLSVGTRVRAKDGVVSPDFPDISFAGWTGKIVEVSGKKAPLKFFIEWEPAVVSEMPKTYIDRCEEQQIYYLWACLTESDIEPAQT